MLMKVFGLVFLFIIRLHFLRSQSIADAIRKRYGDKALKNVKKFERLDYQVRKCQLDIEFLNTCHKYNVIPNFLRFHVTNKTLKDSLTYSRCQQLLLNEEIRCKKRHLTSINVWIRSYQTRTTTSTVTHWFYACVIVFSIKW